MFPEYRIPGQVKKMNYKNWLLGVNNCYAAKSENEYCQAMRGIVQSSLKKAQLSEEKPLPL